MTVDERIAVAANRTADTVSVFALAPGLGPNLLRLAELSTGAGSEPWVVTADSDGDSVFVLLRRARQVIRVTDLRSAPRIAAERGVTGSEPTSLALSPTGRSLFVANFADGTVTVLDARTLATSRTIDLNAALAATGVLGMGVTGRVGLAHPRALAVTNNGDDRDDNDALYVTEFFAQRRTTGVSTGLDRFDTDRQGVVYRVPLDTLTPAASLIAPATDMGFRDSNNVVAGCIPNQLHAIAIAGARVYVTAVCASPRGPMGLPPPPTALDGGVDAGDDAGRDAAADAPDADVPPPALVPDPRAANLRTQQGAAIFVLDATNGAEIPARRLMLNSRFQTLYDARRLPDDGASRRMPLIPVDLAFQPGTFTAYVVGYGSDALFRVRFNSDGSFAEVGLASTPGFVNLDDGVAPAGQSPIGVAVVGMNSAYVLNEHTRNVSGVSLLTQTVLNVAASSAPPTGDDARRLAGRRDFVTGTGRWSWQGQAWNSCEACHPDGLSDGVTWYFPRGPRQTPALDGVFARGTAQQRLLGWTAHLDEPADFEALVRDHSGGVGSVVHRVANGATPPAVTESLTASCSTAPPRCLRRCPPPRRTTGLSGAITDIASREGAGTPRSVTDDWADLARYLRAVRTLAAPAGLQPAQVAAGRALFLGHRCEGCHAGALWTVLVALLHPRRGEQRPGHRGVDGAPLRAADGLPHGAGAHRGHVPPVALRRGQRPDHLRAAQRRHLRHRPRRRRDGPQPPGGPRQRGGELGGDDGGRAGGQRVQRALAARPRDERALPPRRRRAHPRGAALRHLPRAPPGLQRGLQPDAHGGLAARDLSALARRRRPHRAAVDRAGLQPRPLRGLLTRAQNRVGAGTNTGFVGRRSMRCESRVRRLGRLEVSARPGGRETGTRCAFA